MKLTQTGEGLNTLHCKEQEYKCYSCREDKKLYYCEQDKRLFCWNCLRDGLACKTRYDHDDILINEVEFE
jgi:hypothetical protein